MRPPNVFESLFRIPKYLFVLTALLSAICVFGFDNRISAQLDPTFGTGGVTQTVLFGNDSPLVTVVLPSGKIHVLARSQVSGQPDKYSFLRYNTNGTLDTSYGTNGIKLLTIQSVGSGVVIVNAVRQPDGKFLLLGQDGGNGLIARFDADGNVDTSFGTAGYERPNVDFSTWELVRDVSVLQDGKVFVAGTTGQFKIFFIRYLSDGQLDKSFNSQGYIILPETGNSVRNLFRQSTGKFLVFGEGGNGKLVQRFNEDGSIDNTFTNIGFSPSQNSRQVILLPDDKIITGENFLNIVSLERNNDDIRIRKFNSDGTVDNTFGVGGAAAIDITSNFYDNLFALAVQSDGQLLVGSIVWVEHNRSQTAGTQLSLARLSSGGVLTGKFIVTDSFFTGVGSITVQPDGNILSLFERDNGSNRDLLLTRVTGVPNPVYRFKGVQFDFGRRLGIPQTNGIADPTVYRGSSKLWYVYPMTPPPNTFLFGDPTDLLVPSDYINDLGTDLAVFRPSNGTWYIAKEIFFPNRNFIAVPWGVDGDIPMPADYDGDSKSDVAVFRPSNGVWYVRKSSDNSPYIVQWGTTGDQPVTGDFDGDGIDDLAVWRPSNGVWYVLQSSNGQPMYAHFGTNGDIPVNADYDGDGKTDFAVWRPSNRVWYLLRSTDGFFAAQWGLSDDVPAPADYTGDKKADITVWRASQGRWYTLRSSDLGMTIFNWGVSTDKPVQGRMIY